MVVLCASLQNNSFFFPASRAMSNHKSGLLYFIRLFRRIKAKIHLDDLTS